MGRFERVWRRLAFAIFAGALFAAVIASSAGAGAATGQSASADRARKINHIVVIYEENHSFDNLYGGLGGRERSRERQRRSTLPRSIRPVRRTRACFSSTST